jgi:hypothetical protein
VTTPTLPAGQGTQRMEPGKFSQPSLLGQPPSSTAHSSMSTQPA